MKLKDLMSLIVPEYIFFTFFTFLFFLILFNKEILIGQDFILSFVSYSVALMGLNVFNMIQDKDLDKINKPHRPIPAGRVTIKGASILSLSLIILSIILSVFVNLYALLVIFIFLVVYFLYTYNPIKLGSFFLSSSIFGTIFYYLVPLGLISVFSPRFPDSLWPLILFFGLLFFFISSIKDIEDIAGEKKFNIKSTFTAFGTKGALNFIICGLLLAYVVMFSTVMLNYVSNVFQYPFIVSLILFALLCTYLKKKRKLSRKIMTQSSLVTVCMAFIIINELIFAFVYLLY